MLLDVEQIKVVAKNLPVEEVANIKQMFHMMDTDKNGNLTLEELKEGLQNIGQPVTEPDVQMLLEAVSTCFLCSCINFLSTFPDVI